jgi:cation transport ATPase
VNERVVTRSKTDELAPLPPVIAPANIENESHTENHHLEWLEIARVAFVALASAAVWWRLWEPFEKLSVIGLAAALIGMFPILKEALKAVWERRMTMELSMTIAIGAALAIGQFFTALVIILMACGSAGRAMLVPKPEVVEF